MCIKQNISCLTIQLYLWMWMIIYVYKTKHLVFEYTVIFMDVDDYTCV